MCKNQKYVSPVFVPVQSSVCTFPSKLQCLAGIINTPKREGTNTGLDYWTVTLEWTPGLTCFWFHTLFW